MLRKLRLLLLYRKVMQQIKRDDVLFQQQAYSRSVWEFISQHISLNKFI